MAKKSSIFGLIIIFAIAIGGIIAGGSILAKAMNESNTTKTIDANDVSSDSSKQGLNLDIEEIIF